MIAIVGAGLAGLSAAYRLITEHTVDPGHVIILEAKNRVGGRIESVNFSDGSRIDLGAQWLHGEVNNPIYKWLDSLCLIEGPEEEESEFEGVFASSTGTVPPKDIVSRVLDILMDAKNFLYKITPSMDKRINPADIYRKHIDSELARYSVLANADKGLIKAVERWFELYEMIDNSCESISNLSIKAYSEWSDYDDGKMILLKGGWQSVVSKLAESISDIRLSHEVEQISYNEQGVIISVINELGIKLQIMCEHVIVTCSLGVLKEVGSNIFVPSLAEARLLCLKDSGFGVVNKIFLQFEEPFLLEEKGLKLLWLAGHDSSGREELPEWTHYITGFDLITHAPKFLLGWVGGHGAKMMEHESEERIGEICLKIFKIFLPGKKVPKLVSVKRSSWSTDRYVRGAYSYPSLKCVDKDTSNLWDPLCSSSDRVNIPVPRVLFAGEATSTNMFATAHGAIISGWREADRLKDYLKQKSGG